MSVCYQHVSIEHLCFIVTRLTECGYLPVLYLEKNDLIYRLSINNIIYHLKTFLIYLTGYLIQQYLIQLIKGKINLYNCNHEKIGRNLSPVTNANGLVGLHPSNRIIFHVWAKNEV